MDEALLKRVLPHSIETEQSVIGSMLTDEEATISTPEIVTAGDFYRRQYGVISESMMELFNKGKPVDSVTLQNRLKEKDVPPEVSSLELVRDIITAVPTFANVKPYANIMREKTVLRRLIKADEEIANTCHVGKDKPEDILAHTEKTIFGLLQSRTSGEFVSIRRVALDVLENVEKASKDKGTVTGVPSGFIGLGYKASGFQPLDFILIAAHPSISKIAFVLNVVNNMVMKKGLFCMVFSLETSRKRPVNHILSMESNVSPQKLQVGVLTDSDWDTVVEGIGAIGNPKLIIDSTPSIPIAELRSKCRKMKLGHGLSLVIIDCLQLISGSGKNGDNRQREIFEISRSLKALAREMQTPAIAPSQLNRARETRQDHRPILSDLQGSGTIEQDVDVVMSLYRNDYYSKDTEDKNIAEAITAKRRNDPIGTVNLVWIPWYIKFANAV